ncbi:MAG TPA: hypothetical protein VHH34_23150, partial [Pseudonocardiaceae bacterium]|nr:hypothetical protein [Pseudonocardiaceae bacterium]
ALLAPWFHDSVAQDDARLTRWRPEGHEPAGPAPAADAVSSVDAHLAAQRVPEVWAEVTALDNLLRTPADVLARPGIVTQVREVVDGGWRPVPLRAPGHESLVSTVQAATSRSAQVPV